MKQERQRCPTCGHNISLRKVTFAKHFVSAAVKMLKESVRSGQQTVRTKDAGLTNIEYSNASYLVNFGLLYKNEAMKTGEYGVPRMRIVTFLQDGCTVAKYLTHNPITSERQLSEERILCSQVPSVAQVRDQYGEKFVEYLESAHLLHAS